MAQQSKLKELLRYGAKIGFVAADFPYRSRPGPRILIYHQVGSGLGRQMEVTVEGFESQLDWLTRNGSVVGLAEAFDRRAEPDAADLYCLTFDDGYRDLFTVAYPRMVDAGVPFTVYVTTGPVESGVPTVPGGRADPVTWDQLGEMMGHGATIGSHTDTHPDLRSLSPDRIIDEVSTSDDLIERRLGIRPTDFCYPYGFWSEAADAVIRSTYSTATLGAGPAVTGDIDPFKIHRIPVQLSDNALFFQRKMRSGMVMEERVRRAINGYRGPE